MVAVGYCWRLGLAAARVRLVGFVFLGFLGLGLARLMFGVGPLGVFLGFRLGSFSVLTWPFWCLKLQKS